MTTKAKRTRFGNAPILYLVGFMGTGKTEVGRRGPYYAKADLHVQVAGQSVDNLALQIRAALVDHLGWP